MTDELGDAGRRSEGFDGAAYQARFDALAAEGMDVHGEARLVLSLNPASVLDAGCGTGRVAVELARHGVEVIGVDHDPSMLAEARRRSEQVTWVEADLADLDLQRSFDVVLLAGNVPLFCAPERRPDLVAACGGHIAADGWLIAGFQLDRDYALTDWDAACRATGLVIADRWSTWDREPFRAGGAYAVSVHRRR